MMPPEGVYPVLLRTVNLKLSKIGMSSVEQFSLSSPGPWNIGALNFGRRPTFKSNELNACAEVFVLDFQEDLYGQTVEVVFYPRLREELRFDNVSQLKQQIAEDVRQIIRYFDAQSKNCFTSSFK
jgi:riboflavin kinase/FMN adenylyltransferase